MSGENASGGDAGGGGVTGDEAAWRDLIARYDRPAGGEAAAVPWPEREDLTARPADAGPGPTPTPGPGPGPGRTRPGPRHPAGHAALGSRARPGRARPGRGPARGRGDDEEHYVPPPPPPLPHLDPIAKGAWTALFGGPAYLLVTSLIGWTVPGWAALLAVMAFVGGFAVVVMRLGDGPSGGEGPDNGAVL